MYDPYYETKVNTRWGRIPIGSVMGSLLVLIGFAAIAFTLSDLCGGMSVINGSVWQENAYWPTIGKGLWVGAIMIATGIIGFISYCERTQVSLYVFNGMCWTTAVFSLYMVLSSILHIQPYYASSNSNFAIASQRTSNMNMEIAMNSLLIAAGGLGFIISIFSAFLSCLAGNCCVNRRRAPPVPYPYQPTGATGMFGASTGGSPMQFGYASAQKWTRSTTHHNHLLISRSRQKITKNTTFNNNFLHVFCNLVVDHTQHPQLFNYIARDNILLFFRKKGYTYPAFCKGYTIQHFVYMFF